MSNIYRRPVAIAAFSLFLSVPVVASAGVEPQWSIEQLVDFSVVILRGHVGRMHTAEDPANGLIYTYIEVQTSTSLRGPVFGRVLVIKQLGGRVEDTLLAVSDQPTFTTGEEVLLFLEQRPRDGSLYTTALAQGKWVIGVAAGTNREIATRGRDRALLADIESLIGGRPEGPVPYARINTDPDQASSHLDYEGNSFVLVPQKWRWHAADRGNVLMVDTEPLGQYGLVGAGRAETARAAAAWSSAGAGVTLRLGLEQGRVCAGRPFPSGRIHVSYRDPCEELSDFGGTIAMAAAWLDANDVRVINGTSFMGVVGGFIINNNSANAQSYLRRSRCFQDLQTHELGHVLGLGHSPSAEAIMNADPHNLDSCRPPEPVALTWNVPTDFFTFNLNGCTYRAVSSVVQVTGTLSETEFAGALNFPAMTLSMASSPTCAPTLSSRSLSMTAPRTITGASLYSFREDITAGNVFGSTNGRRTWGLDFHFCDPTGANPCDPTYVRDVNVKVGLYYAFTSDAGFELVGIRGDFHGPSGVPTTAVTSFAGNGLGPDDVLGVRFIYPGNGIAPPTQVTASVSDGLVTLRWMPPIPAPQSYIVEVGTAPGQSNLVSQNVGSLTQVSGALIPGTYYVRVRAVFAAGISGPSVEVTIVVAPPRQLAAPTSVVAQVNGLSVTLSWTGASGATSYIIQAGTGPGRTDLVNQDIGAATTASGTANAGRIYVRVLARNSTEVSPPSTEISFVVGGCEAPPPPPASVTGRVIGTRASVEWSASPTATGYILQAGSSIQLADLFNGPVGNVTGKGADVSPGFLAYVRVIATNACGYSAATAPLLVQ